MKKTLYFLLAALMVGSGSIYLTSCALQQSPLSPSTTLIGASAGGGAFNATVAGDNFNGLAIAEDLELIVTFAKAMDPTTIVKSNLEVYMMGESNSTTETRIDTYTVRYEPVSKQAIIKSTATWTVDRQYRVAIKTAVKTANGQTLDGNGNGLLEGDLFDMYNAGFAVGGPSNAAYSFSPIQLSNISVNHENGSSSLSGSGAELGAISAANTVTITANFNMPFTQALVFTTTNALAPVFSMVNTANNVAVAPMSVSVTATTSVRFEFTLAGESQYKFMVNGGTNGVRSSQDSFDFLMKGKYFDGDKDGNAEASDDSEYILVTTKADGSSDAPVTVSTISYYNVSGALVAYKQGGYFRWRFTTTDNVNLDPTTINASNFIIKAKDSNSSSYPYYNITPKKIKYDPFLNEVRVYLPDHVVSPTGDSNIYIWATATNNITDIEGRKLDGNSNGIGGEVTDDYTYGYINMNITVPGSGM